MRTIAGAAVLALLSAPVAAQSSGATSPPVGNRLVGLWLGLQQGVRFPLGCDSGEPVRYSSDGTYTGPGASGTWELQNGRLAEIPRKVDPETGDPAAVGRRYVSRIVWEGPDRFVRTFPDGARMTFRRCPGAPSPAAASGRDGEARSRSKGADYLVREQIAEACNGQGKIDPAAVIERDLTGDGKDDLVISHEGITCAGGGRSSFCGAQLCSVNIYVRRGALLKLEREMLGSGVTVKDGIIHMHALGGKPGMVKWNGREFR